MAFQLAQFNMARLLHQLDHFQLREFVAGLDQINESADMAKRYVWRFKTECGKATDSAHPWSADAVLA